MTVESPTMKEAYDMTIKMFALSKIIGLQEFYFLITIALLKCSSYHQLESYQHHNMEVFNFKGCYP